VVFFPDTVYLALANMNFFQQIKYIFLQLNQGASKPFAIFSDVPVHCSELYWQTLSHDDSDRIRAVPITHLLEWTVSLEEDCFPSRRRVSRDRLSLDCW